MANTRLSCLRGFLKRNELFQGRREGERVKHQPLPARHISKINRLSRFFDHLSYLFHLVCFFLYQNVNLNS